VIANWFLELGESANVFVSNDPFYLGFSRGLKCIGLRRARAYGS
jgi:hypothetical protein